MKAGDSWRCHASAGSRPFLPASSLGLPKLTSLGPADLAGSDPGLELAWCPELGSQGRRRLNQPCLQTMAVALPSVHLFIPVSLWHRNASDRPSKRPGLLCAFYWARPEGLGQAFRAAGEDSGTACAAAHRRGQPRGGSRFRSPGACRVAASPARPWLRLLHRPRPPRGAPPPAAASLVTTAGPRSSSLSRARPRAARRRRLLLASWVSPPGSPLGRLPRPRSTAWAARRDPPPPRLAAAACPGGIAARSWSGRRAEA